MKRYMEQRPGAGFNGLPFVRVTEVANDAKLPDGATLVSDDTPAHDWTEAHGGFTPPTPREMDKAAPAPESQTAPKEETAQ